MNQGGNVAQRPKSKDPGWKYNNWDMLMTRMLFVATFAGGNFGKGVIDLGGLEVYEAQYFKKIWDTKIGGPNGLGASFYEPTSFPLGFKLLGHFCKPNTMTMFVSVLAAKDTTGDLVDGALIRPVDFRLIWTSKGLDITQLEDGYIWLPIPPIGYRTLGHIVTTSPQKPSVDIVRCVRKDFTDSTEEEHWLWGLKVSNDSSNYVDIYTTKPVNRELSVRAGTFLARGNGFSTHGLACLKMVRTDPYYAMPNSEQIRAMIHTYAPWVYFHPDEEFFPSSVSWFFLNGVELHQMGQGIWPIMENGDNLPTNGSINDAFLDLPSDESKKNEVKKGYLASAMAYIHVKPAFGGTFTDLAIWIFYPFNGGGKFQLGPFTINLGKIGEHVGDWEHITLRIDNFRGILKEIYLSQHSKGKWVSAIEFEFINGTRPIVYASLHGHTHYNTPSYHLHSVVKIDSTDVQMLYDEYFKLNKDSSKIPIVNGEKFAGFGARDDTAKSDNVMDVASSYNVVCVDYKAFELKPWLKYTGRWGPKITYGFAKFIKKEINNLPDKVKALAIKLLNKLPAELLGQEGPQGPKMRDNWLGDERV
uniref:uncharacterized protein LOC122583418 n=1 Tax=Erigeron canadensis TaxID=72917 RepID=UPI001CB93BF9|nr:uncharacterized protein LOC122583418 [Erigeron canadensis]